MSRTAQLSKAAWPGRPRDPPKTALLWCCAWLASPFSLDSARRHRRMTGPSGLPKFRNPPVREVVISVQFDPLTKLSPIHLGRWWEGERREHYPRSEERPPLPATREQFEWKASQPRFNLRVGGAPPTQAIWFLTEDGGEVLQIQRDRFSRNWTRKQDEYPSYEKLRPAFERDFEDFRAFLLREGIGEPSIVQCEITYVNPLQAGDGWDRQGELQKIFAPWSGGFVEGFLPEPENVQIAARFMIKDPPGTPIGRLYATVQPAIDPETSSPRILLTLAARGRPLGPGLDGIRAFLDLGHEWIVRGFATLTTTDMHKRWDRIQ